MTDRLRVALGTVYPYEERWPRGGIEAVALYLGHALAKRDDVDLHIVSCNRAVKHSFVERRGTITLHWLATGARLSTLRAATVNSWRVRRVYTRIQPDIIHAQGFSEYALAADPRDRLLLSIHGVETLVPSMHHIRHFSGPVGAYRRLVRSRIARLSVQRACGIVSTAGDYIPHLLAPWLHGKAIYTIFNPVADDFFHIQSIESSVAPIVLWVGYIAERKNLIQLINAFRLVSQHIPEARLHLVGGVAEPQYFAKVRDEIAACSLSHAISILGQIDHHALLQAYATASIVAMTSIEETAPMAIAQAMAAGKPVVVTRAGGIPWMVENGVTGYVVDVGDAPGMANRIVELLQDNAKRQRMGRAAREIAEQRFAADIVAERTVQAYRDLLARRK